MIARALERYVRMSPRKVRYVMDTLRGRTVAEALHLLSAMNRRAAKAVRKAVEAAFANARVKDPTLTETSLVISRMTADGGPPWKRFRPAAFGRAVPILKRTSHITVELDRPGARNGSAVSRPAAPPKAPGKAPATPAPASKLTVRKARAAGAARTTRRATTKG